MKIFFRRKKHYSKQHECNPIFCTHRFQKDIERIYGKITRHDDESSAYAHVIAGSAIFYKCDKLPEYSMMRQRASVSTRMDTPEVRKLFTDELKSTYGRSRHVSIHDHPMNFPCLSTCDIRTYERCRTNECDPSPFGCGKPYPVVLVNLSCCGDIELLGFWVIDGRAYRTNIAIIPDDSQIVTEAWIKAPQLAYYSKEAELARDINRTLSDGWNVFLGINPSTHQKALLVSNPSGERKSIPFSNAPLGLAYDNLWKYVDWTRLFVDCFEKSESNVMSSITMTSTVTKGENNEKNDNNDSNSFEG